MTEAIRFLHLTDLHISDPATPDPGLQSDTLATLDRVLDRIAGMETPPAFVIISGDLTNRGDAESYRLLASRLARIGAPKVLALGNHDDRAAFREVMLGEARSEPYAHDLVLAGVHVIVLDSQQPGLIAGRLDDGQLGFLDAALARHPGLPKIAVVHHPPALDPDEELVWWHALDWPSSERLGALLEGRVAGLLCGHVHVPRVSHWHGLPVVVGNGLHNTIDPLVQDGMRMIEPTGFSLCTLRPSGLTVEYVTLPHGDRQLDHLPMATIREFR